MKQRFFATCLPTLALCSTLAAAEEAPVLVDTKGDLNIWSLSGNEYAAIGIGPDPLSLDSKAWGVECPIDAMTDEKKCTFHFYNVLAEGPQGGIFVNFLGTDEPQIVCAAYHDFPGKIAMIRVDRNEPVETNEAGCVSAIKLLPQLINGSFVTVRYSRLPGGHDTDSKHSLHGFSETVDVAKRMYEGSFLR